MGNSRKSKFVMYIVYVVMILGSVAAGVSRQRGLSGIFLISTLLTFVSGVFAIISIFRMVRKRDVAFQNTIATKGNRHEVFIKNSNARGIIQDWAVAAGYTPHVASSDSKIVYSKGGMLLIPIFVSYDFELAKLESWIQANGQSSSIFDGPIVSIPHMIARKDFESLQSMFGVVSLKRRRSDL